MRTPEKKVRRSEQGRGRRGFKPDAAAGSTRKPERNHIRLRGVGFRQYRKSVSFLQGDLTGSVLQRCLLKRLNHYQDNGPDHEDRRYFIDNTIEFLAPPIAVGGEILDAAGKKTVDARQRHHQQKLAVQPSR
jgi:hypothetical protein